MATILDRSIGPIGYGLMGLTWKTTPPSYETAEACMDTAFESGATLWNGGEFYGPPDHNSLHILNKYFTKHPDRADKVTLSIKGGLVNMRPDGSPAAVRASIDECLRVLDGKKSLDLFQVARVDPDTPVELVVGTIAEYVAAGTLRGISLSEVSAATIRRAAAVHPIACVEVEFSLWSTDVLTNGVAAACAELHIPIVAYSPLGRGFLTGAIASPADIPDDDMRKHMPRFLPENFAANLKLLRALEAMAARKGVTPGQVGIAWVVKQGGKDGVPRVIPIPGACSPGRIVENTKLVELTDDEDAEIARILEGIEIVGDRYPGHVQKFNFGDSKPLEA